MAALETLDGTDQFDIVEDKINAAIDALNLLSSTNSICIKILPIGNWDMDSTVSVSIAHGVSGAIVFCQALIINDNGTGSLNLETSASENTDYYPAGYWSVGPTDIILIRANGRVFDSIAYNSTPFNRGYVIIAYLK